MFRKAETTILQFLVMFIVGVVIFFTASPIFANYLNINSRSAQDLDRLVETIEDLSDGSFRSSTLHNMEQGVDYLVFMDKSGPVDLRMYRNANFENNVENYDKVIKFTPDDNVCIEGYACVCIFQGVNLERAEDRVVIPRSVACRSLSSNFMSGGINIMTSFGSDFDLDTQISEEGTSSAGQLTVAGLAGGSVAGVAVAAGTAKVISIGAAVGLMSTVGLPVLVVGGVASAIMYSSVKELAGATNYNGFLVTRENYEIRDPNVLIITNSDENFRSIQLYIEKFGDRFVVCPMIQLCNELVIQMKGRIGSGAPVGGSSDYSTDTEEFFRTG